MDGDGNGGYKWGGLMGGMGGYDIFFEIEGRYV